MTVAARILCFAATVAACLAAFSCGAVLPGGRTLAAGAGGRQPPPGAAARPPELDDRLEVALADRGPGYVPRTHHRSADGGPLFVNRLILEASPYLEQHAHNPVDWYPWGKEAFERARREDKPIFLSIGYSTCHWCHVMERESFEDLAVARLLNESFVAIKVDREQRPDVDELYMTAVMILRRSGGWPLSSFLTTDGRPFFGATYFPRDAFFGLLVEVRDAWRERRSAIEANADAVSKRLRLVVAGSQAAREVDREVARSAIAQLLSLHDRERGGFGGAPKFPHEPDLLLLLDAVLRDGDEEALAAAHRTLSAMARGGIHDLVGGGFHRYTTDAEWLVPHFEKMLYNQAHLARCYLTAWQLTGDPVHRWVARQILRYVRREMSAPDGAFYSATDADSEGREGAFFVWTPEQLAAALGPSEAAWARRLLGVTAQGNFEGSSVLSLPRPLAEVAAAENVPLARLLDRLDRVREGLRTARLGRPAPLRDEKVLVAWNAMMITAYAAAYEALRDPADLDSARRAAEALWRVQWRGEGELHRVRLGSTTSVAALQEDYAYLLEALVALGDATGEPVWLGRAMLVQEVLWRRFWDEQGGGFFMTAKGTDPLLAIRPKSPDDGAVPSGASVAARALAQLARRSDDPVVGERASRAIAALGGAARERPGAYSYLLLGSREHNDGAAGAVEHAAGGRVRISARASARGDGLTVRLEIAEGWHVNGHQPLDPDLMATAVRTGGSAAESRLGAVAYPPAESLRLGFQEGPVAVYRGEVEFEIELRPAGDEKDPPVLWIEVALQACDNRRCLAPEVARLEVPVVMLTAAS